MSEEDHLASRNDPLGFAERTRKNLEFIEGAFSQNCDVHVITQLMLSLLGLVVFPVESSTRQMFEGRSLTDHWFGREPIWKFVEGESRDLGDHMWHLRNAIAHNHVRFSSESRRIDEVTIEFSDHKRGEPNPYWKVEIQARHLRKFCVGLINMIRAL